jgi:DNA-binding HxlR family transcriptional regulator
LKSPGNIKRTDLLLDGAACPLTREVLTRVGDKWSVLVIVLLGGGTRRFSELKRLVEGISQRMLTATLRGLERDGLVVRTVFATVPPRVEYALSPLGTTLLKTVTELAKWVVDSRQEIERARARFDRRETIPAIPVSQHR